MSRLDRHLAEARERRTQVDTSNWDLAKELAVANLTIEQRAFAQDDGERIAALCGRGAGKTTGARARLFLKLLSIPNARLLYIATTRSHAEDLMWGPLKDLIEEHGVVCKFNETKLKLTVVKTGAQLQLAGADNKREIEKYRGLPFHEVIIDESASYPTRLLEHLIYRVISPRLGDFNGSLVLIGTPGHTQGDHPFYRITRPGSDISRSYLDRDKEEYDDETNFWSTHRWTQRDGAEQGIEAMQNLWAAALRGKKRDGWGDKHPVWRREYLGEWAADDTENVYKYRAHLESGEQWNEWTPTEFTPGTRVALLPREHDHAAKLPQRQRLREWRYVVGLDLGHSDPFACQVFAFSPTDRKLWHVYEFEAKSMYPRSIAQLLIGEALDHDSMGGLFGVIGWPDAIVADTQGLGGMVLDELANTYGITVGKADQRNKHDHIELFNGDLVEGRIRVMQGSKLAEQLTNLQWAVDDYGKLKENKGQPNHSTDAAVYARRHTMHLLAEDPPLPAAPATPATVAARLDREAREAEDAAAREGTDEFADMFEGPNDFGRFF